MITAKLIHGSLDHGRIEWQCPCCERIQQEPIDAVYGPSIELICENCGVGHDFEVTRQEAR